MDTKVVKLDLQSFFSINSINNNNIPLYKQLRLLLLVQIFGVKKETGVQVNPGVNPPTAELWNQTWKSSEVGTGQALRKQTAGHMTRHATRHVTRPSLLQDELVDELVLLRLHFGQSFVLDAIPEDAEQSVMSAGRRPIRAETGFCGKMKPQWELRQKFKMMRVNSSSKCVFFFCNTPSIISLLLHPVSIYH